MKCRIGVLGTADIAKRKMIPAILKNENFEYAGVAFASCKERGEDFSPEKETEICQLRYQKANAFQKEFGGKIFQCFEDLLKCRDIDAVYIPLPPANHYFWADMALDFGKHVLMEKPFTVSLQDTKKLVEKAVRNQLVVWENYAFIYHPQVKLVREALQKIGEMRLIRATFGFPHRQENDFRYVKSAGGGALLDCGGYTVRAALLFMGNQIKVDAAKLNITEGHEVDIYGTVTLRDEKNLMAQLAFGMDNAYVCELQIWGSKGMITAPRFFTAPADFESKVVIKTGNEEIVNTAVADQFLNSLEEFGKEIKKSAKERSIYQEIESLAEVMSKVNQQEIETGHEESSIREKILS